MPDVPKAGQSHRLAWLSGLAFVAVLAVITPMLLQKYHPAMSGWRSIALGSLTILLLIAPLFCYLALPRYRAWHDQGRLDNSTLMALLPMFMAAGFCYPFIVFEHRNLVLVWFALVGGIGVFGATYMLDHSSEWRRLLPIPWYLGVSFLLYHLVG